MDNMINFDTLLEKLNKTVPKIAMEYGPKVILAILILWIGLKVITKIESIISKTLIKAKIPDNIRPFLISMIGLSLKVFLVLSSAGILGFQMGSLVAVLAAAGFAVGMALQGSLSNFAAGVLILFFKPYKIGDLIEVHGEMGFVDEIQIFSTLLKSHDNKRIIIPNSLAINDTVKNYSEKEYLRLNLEVSIPYAEDYNKVEKLILETIGKDTKVLKTPAPYVGISKFESHSILLDVCPFCTVDNYWDVYYGTYKNIKAAFSQANIKVAYSEGIELGTVGL